VWRARIRREKTVPTLIITDPILGAFAVDDNFTLEILELVHPSEMRLRLPHGGWRKVSLRMAFQPLSFLRSGPSKSTLPSPKRTLCSACFVRN